MAQLLIDADVLKYRWSFGDYSFEEVCDKVDGLLETLWNWNGVEGFTLCMGSKLNYRDIIYDGYKAKRPPRPPLYEAVANYVEENYGQYIRRFEYLEADDLVSIMQTAGVRDTVIVSQDKDLLQIPGKHFRLFQKEGQIVPMTVTEEEGWRMLWSQALSGDDADKIPGCIGSGKVAGNNFASSLTYTGTEEDDVIAWEMLLDTYVTKMGNFKSPSRLAKLQELYDHYGTEDLYTIAYYEAYQCMLLVRMVRAGEYNFKTKELTLWKPPTEPRM